MTITIRPMLPLDLPSCLALSRQAGWNQVQADWSRFLDLGGSGCFVADREGDVVGSVTTCAFGPIGWVSMLLVDVEVRGGGIGRRLLTQAIEHLESNGVRSVRLDATPLGRPLYEKLGFQVDFELARFAGTLPTKECENDDPSVDPTELMALDLAVTRTARWPLLNRLILDSPGSVRVRRSPAGDFRGYILWREGAYAAQIGPCVAYAEAGRSLLEAAASHLGERPVFIDIPIEHGEAIAWAEANCLRPARPFWRMTRGEPIAADIPRLWASSGPEMG